VIPENINDIQKLVWEIAEEHGWHRETVSAKSSDRANVGVKLALIHSEVSEALEELRRKQLILDIHYDAGKPIGFAIELADIIIRVFDLSESLGIDMQKCLERKIDYNRYRPYRHGDKLL
jgi:NTP pyrophosphatase (non-canonical NTP hydrolase)